MSAADFHCVPLDTLSHITGAIVCRESETKPLLPTSGMGEGRAGYGILIFWFWNISIKRLMKIINIMVWDERRFPIVLSCPPFLGGVSASEEALVPEVEVRVRVSAPSPFLSFIQHCNPFKTRWSSAKFRWRDDQTATSLMVPGDRASEYRSALIVAVLTATVCQSRGPFESVDFFFLLSSLRQMTYPIKGFRIHDQPQSRLNESSYSCQRGD